MIRTKLIIFDLDGTLIDSAPDIVAAFQKVLRDRQIEVSDEAVRSAIGEGLEEFALGLFEDATERERDVKARALLTDFRVEYGENLLHETTVYPSTRPTLTGLLRREDPPHIAIVTNKPSVFTPPTIAGLGLDEFPWLRVYGANCLPRRKPDPEPLLSVMAAASCRAEETLMVGDGLADLEAARRAGVRSAACGFGYTPAHRLQNAAPRYFLHDLADLLDLV